MPPKKAPTKEKEKKKVIEDKTFGMKNKNKSSKVQKFVETLSQQMSNSQKQQRIAETQVNPKAKKLEEQKRKEELAQLFKPVEAKQKVQVGVDPKSVLCAFFKAGQCSKGDKCKFSHDVNVERRSEKIDIYSDTREPETMENWDQETLEEVVNKRHGGLRPPSTIVCKHFIDVIERRQYGWFWTCPNGGEKCQYRHALPPGFILKRDKKGDESMDKEELTLDELVEQERQKLSSKNLTPVTEESFKKWKETQKLNKEMEETARQKKLEQEYRAGKASGVTGRQLFIYQPDLFTKDDDGAMGDYVYENGEIQYEDEENRSKNFYSSNDEDSEEEEDVESGENAENDENDDADDNVSVDEDLFDVEDVQSLDLVDDDTEQELSAH